ncbi:hypothetical protein ABZU86_10845 [Streptomyces sp. NPDC005271]|uniref:hypothetical protein n=1 Tax=unclassified Streptomyces TaxID=2593676 RepID=UPI0033B35483
MISAESYIGSNDFWNTVITVIVTVLVAVSAAWATLRSVNPRRRLIWRQHVNVTLLRDVNPATAISVTHGQSVLSEPRLVELLIKNAGRRDVQSSDLVNAENSLVFDFGVPVVSVLESRVQPVTAAPIETSHSGSELRIHPGLISKRQVLELSVLVDGSECDVALRVASMLETPVKRAGQGDFEPTSKRLLRVGQISIPVVLGAVTALVLHFSTQTFNSTRETLRKDKENMRSAAKSLEAAGDQLILLQNCRYWDVHDPERAKKECPEIKAPASGRK